MSRFFDLVSKPAREMGTSNPPGTMPAPIERRSHVINLDSNENPFGPSEHAIDAMRSTLGVVNLYPDDDCSELRQQLAARPGLAPEQVLVTAGSTALLSLLCQTLLAPGLNAVTSERSFIVYSMAVHAAGARLVEAPMRDDSYDLDAILAAVNAETRIIFLANPNNPTGTMLDAEVVEHFVKRLPGHVVVVLDEPYYEFASYFAELRRVKYSRSLDYVRQGASVVVLRTFSKAHGLAGLRVGYGLGPAELLTYCAQMRNIYSVASLAETAALAAIDDHHHIDRTLRLNADQAQVLTKRLSDLGYRGVPTWTNFIYCDVGQDALDFATHLQTEGVVIRPLGLWGAARS